MEDVDDDGDGDADEDAETPAAGSGEDAALDAAETFDLVADETRLAIVRELARLSSEQWAMGSVGYTALREAVGVEDGGRFNYHLRKLRGTIVTSDGDQYRLTGRGARIARFLRSREVAAGPEASGRAATRCPDCDRRARVTFADGVCAVECSEHGRVWDMVLPPAAGEHHDPEALERFAARRARWYVELARHGACHECWGEVETSVVDAAGVDLDVDDQPFVEVHCDRCALTYWLPACNYLQDHPAVVAFCWDHGLDVRLAVPTAIQSTLEWDATRLDDGLRVEVHGEDEVLALETDGSAEVVVTERREAN